MGPSGARADVADRRGVLISLVCTGEPRAGHDSTERLGCHADVRQAGGAFGRRGVDGVGGAVVATVGVREPVSEGAVVRPAAGARVAARAVGPTRRVGAVRAVEGVVPGAAPGGRRTRSWEYSIPLLRRAAQLEPVEARRAESGAGPHPTN